MWEYLFYILCVALFAYVWYELGSKHHPNKIQEKIEHERQYNSRLEEKNKRLEKSLSRFYMTDEELNGYQSGKDKDHA